MHRKPKSNKPIRWAHMVRAWAMLGLMDDFSKSECLRVRRQLLDPMLKSGRVIQVKRGFYRLADNWEDGQLIHRTPAGNELRFHPGRSL